MLWNKLLNQLKNKFEALTILHADPPRHHTGCEHQTVSSWAYNEQVGGRKITSINHSSLAWKVTDWNSIESQVLRSVTSLTVGSAAREGALDGLAGLIHTKAEAGRVPALHGLVVALLVALWHVGAQLAGVTLCLFLAFGQRGWGKEGVKNIWTLTSRLVSNTNNCSRSKTEESWVSHHLVWNYRQQPNYQDRRKWERETKFS